MFDIVINRKWRAFTINNYKVPLFTINNSSARAFRLLIWTIPL